MAEADWFARALGAAGLTISGLSYWTTWRRDRRDRAAIEPQVALAIWRAQSGTHWEAHLTISNPGPDEVVLRSITLARPAGVAFIRGRSRLMSLEPATVHLADRFSIQVFDRGVGPGGHSFTEELYFAADPNWPKGRAGEVRLLIELTHLGHRERSSRLTIDRTVTA